MKNDHPVFSDEWYATVASECDSEALLQEVSRIRYRLLDPSRKDTVSMKSRLEILLNELDRRTQRNGN